MKKYISCLLVLLALALPMLGMEAAAAETVNSGTCGENVTWTLDSDGLLTISGSGDMENYYPDYYDFDDEHAPWYFRRDSILLVVVEEGITSVGYGAFEGCISLRSITLPESLTSIGDSAFCDCESLTSITLPGSLSSIGDSMFSNCDSLSIITIPEGITSVGYGAFKECTSLRNITLPESLTSIGDYAFAYCHSLSSITLPESVTSIGRSAFGNCDSLTSITLPERVASISDSMFYDCVSLRNIMIPAGITHISEWAFGSCESLTSITILDGVTSIGENAFWGCSSLSNITLPESILLIRRSAFEYCRSLNKVHYAGTRGQKAELTVLYGNEDITDAIWHYKCNGIDCLMPKDDKPDKYLFVDVFKEDYYYSPVLWAINGNITNGVDANHFGPVDTCTRGQIVTFLWRANGSPEPKNSSNPFSDVSSSDYFYKAVLWAVEKGITSGMGDGTFAPGAPCTRGQVATFLWRSQGQPAVSGENIFTDIAPGAYYYDAVLWAVENSITNGMGDGTFAPDSPCTRGQIVTFLYRAMA